MNSWIETASNDAVAPEYIGTGVRFWKRRRRAGDGRRNL